MEGVQLYVCAPLAVSVADCPMQSGAGVATVTTGSGFTVAITGVLALAQPVWSKITFKRDVLVATLVGVVV